MSNPFHDLAAQYDTTTTKLRELGDMWALGTLSAAAEEPVDPEPEVKKK